MNEPIKTEVLIVGAGPTGLAAAATLGKFDIQVIVVEKLAVASTQSKALGVQSGTLECLEQVFSGLVQQMVKTGVPVRYLNIHINQKPAVKVDFSTIPSVYPFILILPQNETERLLEEKMNSFSIQAQRSTELLETKDEGHQVRSKIRRSDGVEQEVISQFVIGCDGAHSVVRHQADLEFEGSAYEGNFILADLVIKWGLPNDQVQVFINAQGTGAFFPIGNGRYRTILIPATGSNIESNDITLDEFKLGLASICPEPVSVDRSIWLTRFRVHHRRANHFQKGRLFLAGDAAHIHSPLGGQGMNTGIQDAVNLGYKLERVLRHGAPLSLLEDYEKERLPVAKSILKVTDMGTQVLMLKKRPILQWLALHLIPLVVPIRWVQKKVTTGVSQIGIARQEIKGREALMGSK